MKMIFQSMGAEVVTWGGNHKRNVVPGPSPGVAQHLDRIEERELEKASEIVRRFWVWKHIVCIEFKAILSLELSRAPGSPDLTEVTGDAERTNDRRQIWGQVCGGLKWRRTAASLLIFSIL
jgi:hypothetical protein